MKKQIIFALKTYLAVAIMVLPVALMAAGYFMGSPFFACVAIPAVVPAVFAHAYLYPNQYDS